MQWETTIVRCSVFLRICLTFAKNLGQGGACKRRDSQAESAQTPSAAQALPRVPWNFRKDKFSAIMVSSDKIFLFQQRGLNKRIASGSGPIIRLFWALIRL